MNSDEPSSSPNEGAPSNPEMIEEFGGEPLKGSGFETDTPNSDFEWRADK